MNLRQTVDMMAQYPVLKRHEIGGLKISIETPKGDIRKGVGKDGKEWKTKMLHDYGYIRMTEGSDGEHVDCYIGPNHDAEKVYVIHQNDPDTGEYDEDKVMIGWDTPEDAKDAYLSHYDRPGFFGTMDEYSFDEFKTLVLATKDEPGAIAAVGTSFSSTFYMPDPFFLDIHPPAHPPSLRNPEHVPDPMDPNEEDDKFLDVTKRDDPEELKHRDKLTVKRNASPAFVQRFPGHVSQPTHFF